MRNTFYFLLLFCFGCARTPRNLFVLPHPLFVSVTVDGKKVRLGDEFVTSVESNLRTKLALHTYVLVRNKDVASYHLSLDFIRSDYKNPFLNASSFSMGAPFSYEMMISFYKNSLLIKKKRIVIFDFFAYPVDVHFRDWYSGITIKELSQNTVERIFLLFEAWVEHE